MAKIIKEECARVEISSQEVKGGNRRKKVSALRATIAKRGLDELGLSLAEIARQVGVRQTAKYNASTIGTDCPNCENGSLRLILTKPGRSVLRLKILNDF
jgi:hypothetical protein